MIFSAKFTVPIAQGAYMYYTLLLSTEDGILKTSLLVIYVIQLSDKAQNKILHHFQSKNVPL